MTKVLLAYEREQDLTSVATVLNARGMEVISARSGTEALDQVRRDLPDVVVSDVLLPRLDGFALCRRIKEDPELLSLPVLLYSPRVEGPKYEAFAAEVGADRFLPRGSTIEELVAAIDQSRPGSSRAPSSALVPELLDRSEHDRLRLQELERQVSELQAANRKLAGVARAAREQADHESRARANFAAKESARVNDLMARIRDLEQVQQKLAQGEPAPRTAAEENRVEAARVTALESRLAELQSARGRAQAAATDAERAFAMQPSAAWICDMETRELYMISDVAAALFAVESRDLRGRVLGDLLPGFEPSESDGSPCDVAVERAEGVSMLLEVRRQSVSFLGRACWLMSARDVTRERMEQSQRAVLTHHAAAFDAAPVPCATVDADGRFTQANPALLDLLGVDAARVVELGFAQLDAGIDDDSTVRIRPELAAGDLPRQRRWRRPDGSIIDVELQSAPAPDLPGQYVLVVREITAVRRNAERAEREQRRTAGVLDLVQQAQSASETEIFSHATALAADFTASQVAYLFLCRSDGPQLELTACSRPGTQGEAISTITRWRGLPPADSALHECQMSQRPVIRESMEHAGPLAEAGLPESLTRQLAMPVLDGGRLVGVMLLADKLSAYDDDDRREAGQVAEHLWRLVRRRRAEAAVVSEMDHMDRVMNGTVEALGTLAELQDGCKLGRSARLAELSAAVGANLGLSGHTVRGLRVIAAVMDIGMLQIPREILWRPGALSVTEYELVKTHADIGAEVLRDIEFAWPVADAVRQHHEQFDGSGYPRGLRGDDILLEARIVAVTDAAEAMLSPRPYRPAMSVTECIDELQKQSGRRYDPRVVKACVKALRDGVVKAKLAAPIEQNAAADQQIA